MLGDAVRGVKLMVLLQLLTRVVTFGLNTLVLRGVDTAVVGAASQLQLITNLTLFFSREAVRRVLARGDGGGGELLAWLPLVPLGLVSCAAAAWIWGGGGGADEAVPQLGLAVRMTLLASLIELAGEPAFVANLRAMRYRARFVIESCAVFAMCATLFVSVRVLELGVLGWGLGQVAYAVVSSAGNVAAAGTASVAACRKWPSGAYVRLWAAFQWQSTQQVLLQEGERIVLRLSGLSLSDQGVYSIVANLGSLLVRSLFLPLEEVACTYFSRLLAKGNEKRAEAAEVLAVVLHLLLLVSLCIVSLGPPLAYFALDLLYGVRVAATAGPDILRAYCVYVSLLGLNGVTEAFVRATISPGQQYRLNALLVVFSSVYVVACFVLMQSSLGSVGLVYANCISMALRLAYSLYFIRGHLPGFQWRSIVPPLPVLAVLAVSRVALSVASPEMCNAELQRWVGGLPGRSCWVLVALGAAAFAVAMVCEAVFDRAWLRGLANVWKGKSKAE